MTILEKITTGITYFDGGMGTLLQARGMQPGELPELWNLTHGDIITDIHRSYYEAGSHVVTTNTFGANCLKFDNLEEIIPAAIENARKAAEGKEDRYVAFDMGPLGRMLKPLGDMDFEEAVEVFAVSVRIAAKCNPDLIIIETMNDAYETKAALLAAKENCDLPVFVTTVYDERGKSMTGADPLAMVSMLEGLGADVVGMNCSLGPAQMVKLVPELVAAASVPVLVNPNAGLPRREGGKTVYDVGPEEYADYMVEIQKAGVQLLGGCCGTTPEYIRAMVAKTKDLPFSLPVKKTMTVVSSYTHGVKIANYLGGDEKLPPVLIGERINPTGKKRFKQALRENDVDYILNEGLRQQDAGAHVLDVNVGLPEIDEVAMMETVVRELQAVTDLPLQLDTVDPVAMEKGMRCYNGKPLVNSVNGKQESMDAVFPLVKKYGGVVIALTLDETGIPETAEGRFAIAERIVAEAAKYGIEKKDIVFDPLAMAVSSDPEGANVTLEAIRMIRERIGVGTSLGVSNISFGLPVREMITGIFFALALQQGLTAAIMNPFSVEMQKTYHSFLALRGLDDNCQGYIEFAQNMPVAAAAPGTAPAGAPVQSEEGEHPLRRAIIKGLKEQAGQISAQLCKEQEPLQIVNEIIIPALDTVGQGFEAKTMFLPQLLMSAEAAKYAFESVKAAMPETGSASKGKVVIATVKGDIHDIGKNIVKVILQNYGYQVVDLGRDVDPELIVEAAKEEGIKLVGLSALMTTTVPAMEETIRQLREAGLSTKVVVGGAVLTQEYADMIKADYYAKDAMETVRVAEQVYGQ